MRPARLVQWCGLFGVSEGAARVALSRMVERGELRAHDGTYVLAGRVGGRRSAQDWALDPKLRRWRGHWRLAFVAGGAREAGDRAALRDAMRRLRYAPVREGVWARPDNLPRASASDDVWAVVEGCSWWSGRPDPGAADAALTALAGPAWERRARSLTPGLVRVTRPLSRRDPGLAAAFVTGAEVVAHLRADPLLPAELVGDAGAGIELRSAYQDFEPAFSRALRAWFRAA